MNILLERFAYLPNATLGRVTFGDETFFTIEQPYNNNLPFISAVPDGEYVLAPHTTKKKSVPGGKCYALVNPALHVYHNPDDIPAELKDVNRGRYACLFTHVANYPRQIQGCIGVGEKLGEHDTIYDSEARLWVNGVSSSRSAVTKLLHALGSDQTHYTLTIAPVAGAVYLGT